MGWGKEAAAILDACGVQKEIGPGEREADPVFLGGSGVWSKPKSPSGCCGSCVPGKQREPTPYWNLSEQYEACSFFTV